MKIEETRIKKFLTDIIRDTRKIERILTEISEDKKDISFFALKYLIIETVEAMANILQHLLAKHFGLPVKGYMDTINKGLENGIISNDVFRNLKPFFDFRNSIIHRYWTVDDEILINNLKNCYPFFLIFCEEIERFILRTKT